MRELTKEELDQLYDNKGCVFCGSVHFHLGPSGGIMQNITCTQCEAEFNVAHPGVGIRAGQLLKNPKEVTSIRPAIEKVQMRSWWSKLLGRK